MLSPGGRPINESPLSSSKTDNWVARRGGLPPYIRGVARGIAKSHGGKVTSRDIAIAVARMKVWAAGGGDVHPAVRAAAAAALAHWEAMKGTSGKLDLAGKDGSEWRHGWEPLNAAAEALKRHKSGGGSSHGFTEDHDTPLKSAGYRRFTDKDGNAVHIHNRSGVDDVHRERFLDEVRSAVNMARPGIGQEPVTVHVPEAGADPNFKPSKSGQVGAYVAANAPRAVNLHPHVAATTGEDPGYEFRATPGHHSDAARFAHNTTEYNLLHELGHVADLHHEHTLRAAGPSSAPVFHPTGTLGERSSLARQTKSKQSDYGKSALHEGYAESFAQFHLGKRAPKSYDHMNQRAAETHARKFGWE